MNRLTPRLAPRLAWAAALLALAGPVRAEVPNGTVKVGVLTDMSGPFADQVGAGSVAAANLAAEDFMGPKAASSRSQIVSADHQNKPDIGVAQARRWVDPGRGGRDRRPAELGGGARRLQRAARKEPGDARLLIGQLGPDRQGLRADHGAMGARHLVARAQHGPPPCCSRATKSWFFVTVDYALGQALERDAAEAVKGREAAKCWARCATRSEQADLSSALLEAQSSGAQVLALANTGADVINSIKQAGEFGLTQKMKVAALFIQLSDVHGFGLQAAQGLLTTEAFYWDLNDGARAFAKRFAARMGGRMPTANHAGVYSATLAYLHAVQGGRHHRRGRRSWQWMKAHPSHR